MGKLEAVKMIGSFVISVGVGSILGNIVAHTTPENTGKIGKACIYLGGAVITAMSKEQVCNYAEKKFDDAVGAIKGLKKEIKEAAV